MAQGPVLSVVDYAAWEKGYMPPSEHVLIDQLAYRGARVVMSSDFGDQAYWLVMRGERLHGRRLLTVKNAIDNGLDNLAGEVATAGEPPTEYDPAPATQRAIDLAESVMAERTEKNNQSCPPESTREEIIAAAFLRQVRN